MDTAEQNTKKNKFELTSRSRRWLERLQKVCKIAFYLLMFLLMGQVFVFIFGNGTGAYLYFIGDGIYDFVIPAGISGALYLIIAWALSPKKFLEYDVKRIFKDNFEVIFLALLLLWVIISTFTAFDTTTAINGNWYRHEGLLIYLRYAVLFLCALAIRRENIKLRLIDVFIFSSMLLAILVLIHENSPAKISFLYPYGVEALGKQKYTGGFYNPNHYGYYLVMAVFASFGMLLSTKNKYLSVYYWMVGCLNFVVLLYNCSLGGLLSTIISVPVMIAMFWISKKKFSYKYVIALLSIVVLCLIFMKLPIFSKLLTFNDNLGDVGNVPTEEQNALGSGRLGLWRDAFGYIGGHPIFGIGLDNYLQDYSDITSMDRSHNEYIQLMLFCGIPALIFYMAFLIILYVKAIINRNTLSNTKLIGLSVLTAYCISAFVGNTMVYTTVYLVVFLAFAWEPKITKRQSEIEVTTPPDTVNL